MDHKSHFHTFHISLLDIAANLQLFRPSIPFLLAKSVYFCTTFSPLKQYTIYSNWTWWFRSNRPKKSRWWILPEPNYKELYFKLFRAVEDAIDILITAQRDCEELYLSTGEDAAGSEVSWHSFPNAKKHLAICKVFFWSCWTDSNCRPLPYQGSALPAELQQHI